MKYLKVKWLHHHLDEPVEIYSEIDSNRWEVRKVELFQDGTTTYVSPFHQIGTTRLAEVPILELEEINTDIQFEGEWISQRDFDRIWLMSNL